MGLLDALGLQRKNPVAVSTDEPGSKGDDAATGSTTAAVPSVAQGVPAATATATAPPASGTADAVPEPASSGGGIVGDSAEQAAFALARVAAVVLIDQLKAHAQAAAIQTFFTQLGTKLATADAQAAINKWPGAMRALEDIKAIAATAKKAADDRQAFTVKLADVTMGANAYETYDAAFAGVLTGAIANANAQATANNYVAANATLDAAAATLKLKLKGVVDIVTAKLAASSANASAAAFLKPELDKAKVQVAAATAALAASRWSEGVMAGVRAWRELASTERMAPRRVAYETARDATVAEIAKVKAVASVADRGVQLDGLLGGADTSASREVMQFEAGVATLRDVNARCAAILAAASDTEAYKRQKPTADAELLALDAHPAAAKVAPVRDTARKQLEQAAKAAAGASTAVDPGPGWAAASNEVVRVRADLASAKTLADGAAGAAGAEAAAAKPGDVAAMKAALQKLKADHASAAAAAFATEAAAPLKVCKDQLDKADKALAKNDGKGAAAPLAAAAKAILEAKAIQVTLGQYAGLLPSVEAKLVALQALPRAASLKGVIDPVATAIADAKAKSKANAGTEAIAALRQASDLAAAATKADVERGRFDTAATAATARVAGVGDAKAKKALEADLAEARKLADAFGFGEAMAALKKLEVGVDKAELLTRAAANPADPQLTALAAKMTANGGGKEVDALVQSPQTTDARMVAALASGRYGVTMVPDTSAAAAPFETQNMKALCKTFAMVPDDVKAAGSINKITHTDSTGGSGSWGVGGAIKLSGRPDAFVQELGGKMKSKDPATGAMVKQLPDIEKDCEPVGGDGEYQSFTALHEVGHGVDDAHTYMQRNGSRDDHGGWENHGSDMKSIADVVGPHIQGKAGGANTFYTKADDKKYVLDKLLNQKPARPASVVAGSDDAKAYDAFDRWHQLATSDGIWQRQGDAEEIAIRGSRVYHMAYAQEWVSYSLAARSKGLTGYQFRAPAEWFAELYAGYKSNKLGPKHPSRDWLKKL